MSKGFYHNNDRNDFKASNLIYKINWDMLPMYLKISTIISLIIGFIYFLAILIGFIGVFL